jgi:hypothetical protein
MMLDMVAERSGHASLPVVFMDETGHTGGNLLDESQSTFAIAAVHLPNSVAQRIIDGQREADQDELHFARLRRSRRGRDQVLAVLNSPELTAETIRVAVMHKPMTTAGKIIDLLLEPVVAARGGDIELFAYQAALGSCRAFCTDEKLGQLLQMLPDTSEELRVLRGQGADALDPTLAGVYEQALAWSDRVGWFVIEHDESKVLSRSRERLIGFSDPASAAALQITESLAVKPLRLADMRAVESRNSPGVQIADIAAGSCRAWLNALRGDTTNKRFVAGIQASGILTRIEHLIWPSDPMLAANLHTEHG